MRRELKVAIFYLVYKCAVNVFLSDGCRKPSAIRTQRLVIRSEVESIKMNLTLPLKCAKIPE